MTVARKAGGKTGKFLTGVNNHGGFGRWAFVEVRDPWNTENEIHDFLRGLRHESA